MVIYSYRFSILLLLSIVLGGLVGVMWGPHAVVLKPLGDIFIHLIYTIIIPLIFFSVSSAIVNIKDMGRLRKIFINMIVAFLITGSIAAIFMIIVLLIFPPTKGIVIHFMHPVQMQTIHLGEELANMITVKNLSQLFLPNNMLALIFIAVLTGLATLMTGEKGKPFAQLLQSGCEVFMMLISFIMYYAPIGFFAFFAVLVAKLGPTLFESYVRATIIYYVAACIYFILAFSLYAYFGNKNAGLKLFWENVTPPTMTALATCSSAASIPANMQATRAMNISPEIYETVIPIGTVLNKQGSVLGGALKIAFLFGVFHMSFFTLFALVSAWIVAILVGTVMGAIPSGGMLGEILILSLYGFPPEALFIIATISILIDPLATVLNVIGNTVCCLLVERFSRDPVFPR